MGKDGATCLCSKGFSEKGVRIRTSCLVVKKEENHNVVNIINDRIPF